MIKQPIQMIIIQRRKEVFQYFKEYGSMKITVFSSNQARRLNLVKRLSSLADRIFFISEGNTVFPGIVSDFFKKSEIMQTYFSNVISAEKKYLETLISCRIMCQRFRLKVVT